MKLAALSDNAHHEVELFQIAGQMKESGLSDEFIASAIRTALEYEGVADLIFMWAKENDVSERDEIIADIQDMIEACAAPEKAASISVRFNDLTTIAKNIRLFKDNLLKKVMIYGGIKKLADETGIPQPSLSRFFNSNSVPQRITLLKIAEALKLEAIGLDRCRGENDE